MIGNENNSTNNIANRRNHQYQDINNINQNFTPKLKYFYQNTCNNMNKSNFSSNNSFNKNNVKMNINMNRKNLTNMNNNNRTYNNIIRTMNSSNPNNSINRAIIVIKNEFRKKDEKIKNLELKIAELENKINMLSNSNNFQSNYNTVNQKQNPNLNPLNLTQKKTGKNFTFAENFSEEINPSYNTRENINRTPEINYNRDNNPFRNNVNNRNNNNYYVQTQSANQYKIKNNKNDEFIFEQKNSIGKNNNANDTAIEGSVFTGNSSNFQRHSKNEVKLYLKEVKSKVDPIIFKEFIQNIKLLTNSKNKNGVDKKSVIEKVRLLFGEQFKDLFIKFESILGFTN
jgi:hypothetical protein